MGVASVQHMNAGNSESSYAKNSAIQKTVILKSRLFLEKTVEDYAVNGFPECFKIADLGCSSGPNTLLVVTNIIDSVHEMCRKKKQTPPEIQVFLNDLADNDFNTIFKMVPIFYSKIKGEKGENSGKCFMSGVPGSFYTRLFPRKSIHFVHSSYSVHWLSQVPRELENNKGNIYVSKTSPPGVYEAYSDQFKKDLSKFLSLRAEEVISDGRMVLTMPGRSSGDPTGNECCGLWDLLVMSLNDMVAEGLVHQEDINSFNVPLYYPSVDELKAIVQHEGSFRTDRLETTEVNWDMRDDGANSVNKKESSGKIAAMSLRSVVEPMLAAQFGDAYMDKIFDKFAVHADDHLSREKTKNFNIVISLTRNAENGIVYH